MDEENKTARQHLFAAIVTVTIASVIKWSLQRCTVEREPHCIRPLFNDAIKLNNILKLLTMQVEIRALLLSLKQLRPEIIQIISNKITQLSM